MFTANIEQEVFGSVAVDALTISFKGAVGKAQAVAIFEELAAISTDGVELWSGIGYKGWQVDGIFYGVREGHAIIIAKGDTSMRLFDAVESIEPVEDRQVTRVDYCIDFQWAKAWPTYLREMHANKGLRDIQRQAKREFKLISSTSGDTLYFGKRTSSRYGRIYDKSAFYDLPRGSVYRYEIETKKDIARAAIKSVFPAGLPSELSWEYSKAQIRRIIRGQFLKWGVNVEWDNVKVTMLRGEMAVTSSERRLEWLQRSVAPVVTKLRRAGYEQQAFDALGITSSGGGQEGTLIEVHDAQNLAVGGRL